MNKQSSLVIGTRGSRLALVQANIVAADIRNRFPHILPEIRVIKTHGDLDQKTPFSGFSGTGLFVKEIERSLLCGAIDLAVHSMKDVPTEMDPRLTIGAVLEREDARDVLVSRCGLKLSELPPGATVGTSSPRRRAQLLHMRRDLRTDELRGNLDTRLHKLDEGQYDAIVVAFAGLIRLGFADRVTEVFDVGTVVPAVGQGALAIQVRRDDAGVAEVIGALNVPFVEAAVNAERAFLTELGGGCQMPIGAHAIVDGDRLTIVGCISDPQGKQHFQNLLNGDVSEAEALGAQLAAQLLDSGATSILE